MTLLYSFFWLLFWETIQNIPSVVGVVFTIKSWKSENKWLKFIIPLLGGIGTVIMLGVFENIKLQVTTLPSESVNNMGSIAIGVVTFTVFILLAGWYYSSKWSSTKSDVIFGVSVALLLTALEVWANVVKGDHAVNSYARVFAHTISFLLAFPATVVVIRKASQVSGGMLAIWTLAALLLMSGIIVAIDYLPFVR